MIIFGVDIAASIATTERKDDLWQLKLGELGGSLLLDGLCVSYRIKGLFDDCVFNVGAVTNEENDGAAQDQ